MLLLAEISVEVEADDFVDAAAHQEWFAALFNGVKNRYPAANYDFRAKKASTRRRARIGAVVPVKRGTGALNSYVDE